MKNLLNKGFLCYNLFMYRSTRKPIKFIYNRKRGLKMQIRQLKLLNFRNYEKLLFIPNSKFNLIFGKNGMGKTNLVESIYVLALTRSFRSTVDKVIVMNNKEVTKIEADVKRKRVDNFQIIINNNGKKVKINNNKIAKLSDYISNIGVVLFNPDDLRIIKDAPSTRRKSLNVDISQLNNNYLKYLNNYNKLLKQRNAYLKNFSDDSSEYLDSLTENLILYGLKVYSERKNIISSISEKIQSIFFDIMKKGSLKIKYVSDYDNKTKEEILSTYKKNLKKDLLLGKTDFGIHKDDYLFYLDDKLLKDYGSEGQQKNAIIAYKFAMISIYYEFNNDYPILILDDLFSELDSEKINNILKLIGENLQTFITTTEIDKVDEKILKESKKFFVENGLIKEV